MNIVNINEMAPGTQIVSIDNVAAYLNLFYQEVVDVILEYITIFSDDELIQEIINILDLNITCVVEKGTPIGYITRGGVKV